MLKLSYKVGKLQIKFINLLYNLNLDNNQFNELVSKKDANIANGIVQFQKFIKELSDKFNKPELKSCINYIENRVDNNAEDFDFMFKSQNDIERSYKLGIDQLFDDCNFVIENRKNVSKQIIDACNKIYKQIQSSQISFNDLNKQTNKLRQNKYGIQKQVQDQSKQKQESWKNLQHHKIFSSDNFTVYQVDTYEDMRNVAGDCASWCVARRDGISHFYYYKPPYYLFSKGFHHPYILMHINSHQFKNTDNIKFSADRPSSLEAIEIGKKFLIQKLHYNGNYKGDFEVFQNINSNLKDLDSNDVLINLSQNENTPPQILKEIAEKINNEKVLYDLIYNPNTPSQILKMIAEKINNEKVLYDLIYNPNTSPQILKEIAEKIDNENILQDLAQNKNTPSQTLKYFVEKYKDNKNLLLKLLQNSNTPVQALKMIIKKTDDGQILRNLAYNQNTPSQMLKEIAKKTDDGQILYCLAVNENTPAQTLKMIAKKTNDKSVLINLAYNSNTPVQALKMIDKKIDEQYSLINLSYNPNTSVQALKMIIKKTDDIDVLSNLAKNKNTPSQALKIIAEKIDYIYILRNLAQNQNTPSQALKIIAEKTNDEDVLYDLAYNQNTPSQVLQNIAEKIDNKWILKIILSNKNTSVQTLQYIAEKIDDKHFLKDRDNNISLQSLKIIVENTDDNDVLYDLAYNQNTPSQILKEIAKKTDDKDVLQYLAQNENTSSQTLKEIAKKTDNYYVLSNLAKNENIPSQVLNEILNKFKGEVLSKIVEYIKNKEYLKYLSKNSKSMYVLGGICANYNVDEQILINVLKVKKNDELYQLCLGNKNCTKKVAYIIGLNTSNSNLIKIIFHKYGFTESQIYEMIQKNNVCRFDILKNAYVLLSNATLSKIQKYFGKDEDIKWLLDQINKNKKIQMISHRIVKSYIINKIAKHITFKVK